MSERAKAWLVVAVGLALTTAAVVYLRGGGEAGPRPERGPLASPAFAPGTVGGLLPDVSLANRNGVTQARGLRPAIVLLVGDGCDCLEVVRQVVAEAAPLRIPTYVVVEGSAAGAAESLAARSGGEAGGFADPGGALARAYGVRANATLVLVRRDGVVNQVVPAVAPTLRLRPALRALVA